MNVSREICELVSTTFLGGDFNSSSSVSDANSTTTLLSASHENLTEDPYGTDNNEQSHLVSVERQLVNIIHTILCVMGVVGNILNMVVLTRRRLKAVMSSDIEKASHLGLVSLAVCDSLYCLTALPDAFVTKQTVFSTKNVQLFVRMYGKSLQNIFMRTSTWLTVITATGRYLAICWPLHARYLVKVKSTLSAIILSFLVWGILELPSFWTYQVAELTCPQGRVYILDRGYFVQNKSLQRACVYIWSFAGYLIPVIVLIYCNFHLIRALRRSCRVRRQYRVHARHITDNSQITPTLVAIVCMFIILVSPSEIMQFYFYYVTPKQVELHSFIIMVTNLLHTMNFALNFVLYCLVNRHFRTTSNNIFLPVTPFSSVWQ